MMGERAIFLKDYSRYNFSASPPDFLSGDLDKREAKVVFEGKREDDLNGAVKRRFLSDLNRWFWENPRDADDTRLVFEAVEKGSEYGEKGGRARLALRLEIGLASRRPGSCGCL